MLHKYGKRFRNFGGVFNFYFILVFCMFYFYFYFCIPLALIGYDTIIITFLNISSCFKKQEEDRSSGNKREDECLKILSHMI